MQLQTVKTMTQELKARKPELATRIEKAAQILATRQVEWIGRNLYRVESQCKPGSYHLVELGPRTCDCWDFENNRAPQGFCKHVIAVITMVRAEAHEARGEALAVAC